MADHIDDDSNLDKVELKLAEISPAYEEKINELLAGRKKVIELNRLYNEGKYTEVIDRYERDWQNDVKEDSSAADLYRRAKEKQSALDAQAQEPSFEIVCLINQAESSLRLGYYAESMDLLDTALSKLEEEVTVPPHVKERANELYKAALLRFEQQRAMTEILVLLQGGDWETAGRVAGAGAKQYSSYPGFETLHQKIGDALKEERRLVELADKLTDDADIDDIFQLEDELKTLPQMLENYQAEPTRRQQRTLDKLQIHKERLRDELLRAGNESVDIDPKMSMVDKVQAHKRTLSIFKDALRLDPDNEQAAEALASTRRAIERVYEDQRRRRRSVIGLSILLLALGIIIGCALVLGGVGRLDNQSTSTPSPDLTNSPYPSYTSSEQPSPTVPMNTPSLSPTSLSTLAVAQTFALDQEVDISAPLASVMNVLPASSSDALVGDISSESRYNFYLARKVILGPAGAAYLFLVEPGRWELSYIVKEESLSPAPEVIPPDYADYLLSEDVTPIFIPLHLDTHLPRVLADQTGVAQFRVVGDLWKDQNPESTPEDFPLEDELAYGINVVLHNPSGLYRVVWLVARVPSRNSQAPGSIEMWETQNIDAGAAANVFPTREGTLTTILQENTSIWSIDLGFRITGEAIYPIVNGIEADSAAIEYGDIEQFTIFSYPTTRVYFDHIFVSSPIK